MIRRPPRSTRTDTHFPYTTLFRSHAAVVISMAGDFMPCVCNPAEKRRVTLSHPAQCEEGRLDARLLQQGKHSVAVPFDTMVQAVPIVTFYGAFERAYLKPILDIH